MKYLPPVTLRTIRHTELVASKQRPHTEQERRDGHRQPVKLGRAARRQLERRQK